MNARNQETNILKRKYGNTLVVCGYATIALTIWSLLKSILYFTFVRDIRELFGEYSDNNFVIGMVMLIVGLLVLVDFLVRLYVYKSAVIEGKGIRDKGYLYLVLSVFMVIASVATIILTLFQSNSSYQTETQLVVAIIVDATSVVCNIELIYSAIRLKKIKKSESYVEEVSA